MVGEWQGESEGQPGKGTVKRTYTFVLHDRLLYEENDSTYPPQPKNEKGETHEHRFYFGYERSWRAGSYGPRAGSTGSARLRRDRALHPARTWTLLREALGILLEGTPSHVNLAELRAVMEALPGVEEVHDLHVWTITSGMHALSAHATLGEGVSGPEALQRLRESVARFEINHVTIQLEGPGCTDPMRMPEASGPAPQDRGANAMIAIPATLTQAPRRSQRSGAAPSTSQSQRSATATYTPP
jgi:hypothetical protein